MFWVGVGGSYSIGETKQQGGKQTASQPSTRALALGRRWRGDVGDAPARLEGRHRRT